jgi:hypothetical protein
MAVHGVVASRRLTIDKLTIRGDLYIILMSFKDPVSPKKACNEATASSTMIGSW